MAIKPISGGARPRKSISRGARSRKFISRGARSKKIKTRFSRRARSKKIRTRFTKVMKRKARHEKQLRSAKKNAALKTYARRPRSHRVDTPPLADLPEGFIESFPNVTVGGKFAVLAALPEKFWSVSKLNELVLGGNVSDLDDLDLGGNVI